MPTGATGSAWTAGPAWAAGPVGTTGACRGAVNGAVPELVVDVAFGGVVGVAEAGVVGVVVAVVYVGEGLGLVGRCGRNDAARLGEHDGPILLHSLGNAAAALDMPGLRTRHCIDFGVVYCNWC